MHFLLVDYLSLLEVIRSSLIGLDLTPMRTFFSKVAFTNEKALEVTSSLHESADEDAFLILYIRL